MDIWKSKIALYLWWGLNIAIVVFVFLAFLMSTLSYAHSKDLANQVNNSFYTQQGGLIEKTYTVAPAFTIKKGSVASFCGPDNDQLCEGLGPVWGTPFFSTESWTPAVQVSVAPLSLYTSVYFHVVDADHHVLRATYVDTSASGPASIKSTALFTSSAPVTSVHGRPTSTPNTAVVMYTTHNETYLLVTTVTATGGVAFYPAALPLFATNDPGQNTTFHHNIAIAESWIIITHAYDGEGALYDAYTIDTTNNANGLRKLTLHPGNPNFGLQVFETIASVYLGNGFFLQSNANHAVLGKIDFNAMTISSLGNTDLVAHFENLQIHITHPGTVLFVGSQNEFVAAPLTLSLFVEWNTAAPYLRAHWPTDLLGTTYNSILYDQVSVCYLPPTPQEPYGGIFFAYVDARTQRAKIARGRPVYTGNNLHLLPSPSLDISAHTYGRFRTYQVSPHLTCPIGTGASHVLIILQDFATAYNTFTWAGGYRYAGIAQATGNAAGSLDIIRQGISAGHERLVPGFSYYIFNNGSLAPFQSYHELFTPNGHPLPIGTALSPSQLHLELEVFDRNI